MMKIRPDYFTWPAERQERYGVAIPEEDRKALAEALLLELFGRAYATREEAVAAVDCLSLEEQNRWNETVLPLNGIGEDCFYLNEGLTEDKSILDFQTVRAFDEDDYRFQEAVRKEDDPGYAGKPYRGSLYLNWARLYIDGRLMYATLSMAAGYLYAQLSNVAQELLAKHIPHHYVPGKHHGKAQGEHYQWDLRIDANGQECLFNELRQRIWHYEHERYDALRTSWDHVARVGVYLLDESDSSEVKWHVIFTDKQALDAVRFRSFLRDCRAIARPENELHREFEEEKAALARFIEEQHADIVKTYDPKVTKLRKRRKVMVMKDDLEKY
jgi:hypothetical protein